MGFEHFGEEIAAKTSFLEVPHLEGIENEFYDSGREMYELPEIFSQFQDSNENFAPSMEIQAEEIKDVYYSTPELQFDNWKTLDIEERTKLLETFEGKIADIEKRQAMPVRHEPTEGMLMGYNDGQKIVISDRLVGSNEFGDYKEMLNTLFHEGRHSYQNHNLYIARTERSDELYDSWVINKEKLGYSSSDASFPFCLNREFREKSYYKYYTQPVEVDARLFAEAVENKIGLKTR